MPADLRVNIDSTPSEGEIIARHGVRTDRGARVQRLPVVPQSGQIQLQLEESADIEVGDTIEVQQRVGSNAYATRQRGVVERLTVDPRDYRQAVRAYGRLYDLAQLKGVKVNLRTNVLVSEAIAAVFAAAGLASSAYSVGASTRRLTYFWLSADDDVLQVLRRLVVTDGPLARLYERADGVIVFEPHGARTSQARSTALQRTFSADDTDHLIFSAVGRQRQIPATGLVSVRYQTEQPSELTAEVLEATVRVNIASNMAIQVDAEPGEVVVFLGSAVSSVRHGTSASDPEVANSRTWTLSGVPIAYSAVHEMTEGDGTSFYLTRHSSPTSLAVLVIRSSGSAAVFTDSDLATTAITASGSISVPQGTAARRGDIVAAILQAEVTSIAGVGGGGHTVVIPDGWSAHRTSLPVVASRLVTEDTYTPSGDTFTLSRGRSAQAGLMAVVVRPQRLVTLSDFSMDANERREFVVSAGGIFTDAPTVTWTAERGSATLTLERVGATRVRVTAVAGSQGAFVSNVRIGIGELRTFAADEKTATGSAGGAELSLRSWEHVTPATAQAIADDWAAYGANEYRVTDITVPGDRNTATITGCLATEISDRVAVEGIDAIAFDGWVENIRRHIHGPRLTDFTFTILEAPTTTAPRTPGNLVLSPGNARISASWDASSGATSYAVRYRTDGSGSWTTISSITGTSRTITGLTNGTAYEVQVRATNAHGSSSWSASQRATPLAVNVPARVATPTLTAGDAQIGVAWSAPANGGAVISDYDVQYRVGSSGAWTSHAHSGTGRTATITGLTNGTEYEVQVRAVNSVGDGPWSPSASATPMLAARVPDAPTAPTVTPGNAQLVISWTAPANNGAAITGYRVRITRVRDSAAITRAPAGTTTSYTASSLTNGEAYDVEVLAINSVGAGAYSPAARGTPASGATQPSRPAAPTLVAGDAQLAATWTAPANGGAAITHYDVRHKLSSGSTWTQIDGISGLTRTITGLTNGSSYDVQVRAANSVGDSDWSPSAALAPVANTAPLAPTSLAATPGDALADLVWVAGGDGGSAITGWQYRQVPVAAGAALPTMTKYSRGSVTHGTASLAEFRAQCVAANQDTTYTPPDPIVSDIATPPVADNYIIRQRFLIRVTERWNRLDLSMPDGCDDGCDVFLLRSDRFGTITDTQIASVKQTYTPSAATQTDAITNADWGDADADGVWWAIIETYTTEVAGGQVFDWRIGYRIGSTVTNERVVNAASGGLDDVEPGAWQDISGSDASTTSHRVSSLTNGTEYAWQVRAVNAIGNGAASPVASATPTATLAAPGVPRNVAAVGGNGRIDVTWDAPNSGGAAASYRVEWGTGGSYSTGSAVGTATLAAITGLTNGTTYNVRVRAQNATGNSAWVTDTATPVLPLTAPGALASLTLTAARTSMALAWGAPTTGGAVVDYDVQYFPPGGSWTDASGSPTSGTSLTISGLTAGTNYSFRVRAANTAGNGPWTTMADSTLEPLPAAPGPPRNVAAVAARGSLEVSWDDPSTGGAVVTFSLRYRAGVSGAWTEITGITTNARTITGLTGGTSYQVAIQAVNTGGVSAWVQTSGTPTAPAAPSVPRNLTATVASATSVTLAWDVPSSIGSSAITGYEYRYRLTGAADWATVGFETDLTITITGLTTDAEYEFSVAAANSDDTGPHTTPVRATPGAPLAAPGVPRSLVATAGNAQLALSWTAPAAGGAVASYRVEWGTGGSYSTGNATVTGTSRTITGLTNGTTYNVRVRAQNATGNSAWVTGTGTPVAPATAPAAPAAPTLTPGAAQISVAWDAPANGGAAISDYDVQYRAGSSGAWTSHAHTGTGRTATIAGLTNGTEYEVQVRATNSVGSSPWSPEASATPMADIVATAPDAPAAPTLTPGNAQLGVAWAAPSDGGAQITDYDVQYREKQ